MRQLFSLLVLVTVMAACASAPRQYRITGTVSVSDPFDRTQRILSEMDYTMVNAERNAGLLIAEKEEGGKGMMGLGVHVYRLTVNLQDDGTVSVTASTKYGDEVDEPTAGAVSDEAMQDAEELRQRLVEGS